MALRTCARTHRCRHCEKRHEHRCAFDANRLAFARERRHARAAHAGGCAMKIAAAIIVVFCARFLMGALSFPAHDGDIAWQQWLGTYVLHQHMLPKQLGPETFTSSGAPWIPQEWAFSVAVAWFVAHGRFWMLAADRKSVV